MTSSRSTRLTLWLSMAALATPFIWIKIGPQGQAFYGPDVPDIYIIGATILGKDRGFPGIAIAIRFQLIVGLLFILCSYLTYRSRNALLLMALATTQLVLLLLFPFWLMLYARGVIDNSDGAVSDLQVYPHIGLPVYTLLLALVFTTFKNEWQRRGPGSSYNR